MFSLGGGRAPIPTVYIAAAPKNSNKKETPPPSPRNGKPTALVSLEPAIDGPPSPERIRAYTEQMKRSSMFGNNSRSNTLSSGTCSSRSRESIIASTDHVSLSRRSSSRSNNSSMLRHDKPESVQIFSSLFSRSGRKTKRVTQTLGLHNTPSTGLEEGVSGHSSAKQHYYGKKSSPDRRKFISGPYNFQHVTHTQQEHLPNLGRATEPELISEFSAIRASQIPTHGELRGIRAEDLHFENFSSEALSVLPGEIAPTSSARISPQRTVRQLSEPAQLSPQRAMHYAKSHDNLRTVLPQPPDSPPSPPCPPTLPARTSSRTASILFETFDPLATTTIARPHTNGGFSKPAPFVVPLPSPTLDEQDDATITVTTPGNEAWPLTTPLSGTFGIELADVQEEEEETMSKKLRWSTASAELRMSQSVPALRLKSQTQTVDRPEARRMSTTLGQPQTAATFEAPKQYQTPPGVQINDSWESDIDWCYENGEESCDYPIFSADCELPTMTDVTIARPQLQLSLQTEERTYRGRFRPSLSVTAFDAPDLSPRSNVSTPSSDPRTPANLLQTGHIRSPSHASSFKESHGFNLSPTLLIPADFQSQMEQDAIYTEHFGADSSSGKLFMQDPYVHAVSPIDEGESSTSSYRSSDFSRRSTRSSSSTRASGTSRGSQDSMMLLGRSSSMNRAHRSIESNSSLPDLIPSTLRRIDHDLSTNIHALMLVDDVVDSAPSPDIGGPIPTLASIQHRRNKSLILERELRNEGPQTTLPVSVVQKKDAIEFLGNLSPVAEAFPHVAAEGKTMVHGRKTSAPEAVAPLREFKSRARASTAAAAIGKRRGSYMLFPQT
ncbi:uncharacterized protein RAG0_16322 [Rhynchosporium agropyri]|uniref:CRIB domain-containing protein n=1 Tax=Rhynchosporium agropyri TaxID=914238 RepID=A0A1E1LPZ2_9HELO|nr:uncharacterized protein RAG0_16322 [Rhynchosporium agropyri]